MLEQGSNGVDSLKIDFVDIFVKLVISFLIPTVLGKGMRDFIPAVYEFQKTHKVKLSMFSNSMLAMLIWQTVSSGSDKIINASFGNMLLVIISTVIIHLLYLLFNTIVVYILRVPLYEGISAVIMASQKSAPVAVTVITYLTSDTEMQGVLAVPCVIGQLVQIFVGQPLAYYLADLIARSAPPPLPPKDDKEVEIITLGNLSGSLSPRIIPKVASANTNE